MAGKLVRLKSALKQVLAFLLIVGFLLGMLSAVVLWQLWKVSREYHEAGQEEAREGVQLVAERLRDWNLEHGSLPPEVTPELLAGQDPDDDWVWRSYKRDIFGYSIDVQGESPRYAGTTVTYHGERWQQRIVLTITDLAASDWTAVEDPPRPRWRLLWCD